MKKKENLSEEPSAQYSKPLDFEQVWLMFQETKDQFRATGNSSSIINKNDFKPKAF